MLKCKFVVGSKFCDVIAEFSTTFSIYGKKIPLCSRHTDEWIKLGYELEPIEGISNEKIKE